VLLSCNPTITSRIPHLDALSEFMHASLRKKKKGKYSKLSASPLKTCIPTFLPPLKKKK
jgi:hypothetical protein